MKILGYKHKKSLLLTAAVTAVGVIGFLSFNELYISHQPIAEVKISDFAPGTSVDYRIIFGNTIIAQSTSTIKKGGSISLPLNNKMLSDTVGDIIKYELSLSDPNTFKNETSSAEILNILLELNKKSGDILLSASGLDEYSNITVQKRGTQKENLHADWAGLFSAKLSPEENISTPNSDNDSAVKLAFQNSGISGDLKSLGSGEIEVFFGLFGDNNGSTLADVQSRWSRSLIMMTEELTAVMVKQTQIIGMFFDASIQMETQRKHQELMARAHKDYHPSEQMCRIGTFIRSVAHTESKSEVNKHAVNKLLMNEYLGVENSVAAGGIQTYENAKLDDYVSNFCDTKDNSGATASFCNAITASTTAAELKRFNKDIDYTRTLASKLTLDIDFTDSTATSDEEDIIALAKHLYFPSTFDIADLESLQKDPRGHYASRSYAAKMGVVHNSFVNIIGMKAAAPAGQATTTTAATPTPAALSSGVRVEAINYLGTAPVPLPYVSAPITTRAAVSTLTEDSGWAYMKAMMREFGIQPIDMNFDGDTVDAIDMTIEEQIDEMLGVRPSYYAQMEILTKKMYQTPDFYTNLYDKPANVKRIGVSLDAITLMHQRDRFESLLRREMLTAVMVEEALQDQVEEVNANIYEAMQRSQIAN